MRVALFHDDDPRLPRLRQELGALGHEVIVVGPGVSLSHLGPLFDERRPDILHSLGRGPIALVLAAYWRKKLDKRGSKRAHDVAGVPFVDAVIDGSLAGEHLVEAYFRLLRLR
jgi:hypothetical protein